MARAELETLSTKELHDRAVARAERHLDVGFLWSLVKALPIAEEVAGHDEHGKIDIARPLALLNDFFKADEGELGEALRPLYVDYLEEQGDD
ncbi:MAG: hypothetical protein HY240_10560 [Actinobacteria bacterium]|nr:hypothetical protein [Actinomycetota bacterium]